MHIQSGDGGAIYPKDSCIVMLDAAIVGSVYGIPFRDPFQQYSRFLNFFQDKERDKNK